MVIREDEEELSPERAASPGPRSEKEEHAEARKVQEEVLREAAGMGFDVGGLTAEGLCAGDEAMVLALLWQLAHAVLLAPVNVHSCTELESLLLPGEEQSAAPDDLLFRWLNHHLHQGNRQERVVSWTDPNLRSGVAYAVLLDEVAPPPLRPQLGALREAGLAPRRARVLLDLDALGVRAFRPTADGILLRVRVQVVLGHSWSSLVILGHPWSSLVILGHPWSFFGHPWSGLGSS